MKTIYLMVLGIGVSIYELSAQTVLFQSSHEPVIGSYSMHSFDSVGTVPKGPGANVMWNFSNFVSASNVESYNYVGAGSVPSSSLFPSATLAQDLGNNYHVFFRSGSSPAVFELIGEHDGSGPTITSYTNPLIMLQWPIVYNTTFSDTYSGTMSGGIAGTITGSFSLTAPGEGSVALPGGLVVNNVLQLKTVHTISLNLTSPSTVNISGTLTKYEYFMATQRYPVASVSYEKFGTTSVFIGINQLLVVGITDENLDAPFSIYPNPARTNFYVNFKNALQGKCTLEIWNVSGQLVKVFDLGSASNISEDIDITDLGQGVYYVKTSLGDKKAVRKLIVE